MLVILSYILCAMFGFLLGALLIWRFADKAIQEQGKSLTRTRSYYEVLNQWVRLKNEGKQIEEFFEDNNYKTIAIYGYAELGHRLHEELVNSKK